MNKIFDFEYKLVMSDQIFSDLTYQRPVDPKRVKKIEAKYDANKVNPIKVSYRENEMKYYVWDGQHTREIEILHNGGKHLPVMCKVYYGMSVEDEAKEFAEQHDGVKTPTKWQFLKAKLASNDPEVLAFVETIQKCGVTCDFTNGQSKYKLICYAQALNAYKECGDKHLAKILRIINKAFEGDKTSYCGEIFGGVDVFLRTYGDEVKEMDLVKGLKQKISPSKFRLDVKAMKPSMNNDVQYITGLLVLNAFNAGKKAANRIDDKLPKKK